MQFCYCVGNSGCFITHLILSQFLVLNDQKAQLKCLLETIDNNKWNQKLVSSSSKISVFFLNMHQEVGGNYHKLSAFKDFICFGIIF